MERFEHDSELLWVVTSRTMLDELIEWRGDALNSDRSYHYKKWYLATGSHYLLTGAGCGAQTGHNDFPMPENASPGCWEMAKYGKRFSCGNCCLEVLRLKFGCFLWKPNDARSFEALEQAFLCAKHRFFLVFWWLKIFNCSWQYAHWKRLNFSSFFACCRILKRYWFAHMDLVCSFSRACLDWRTQKMTHVVFLCCAHYHRRGMCI